MKSIIYITFILSIVTANITITHPNKNSIWVIGAQETVKWELENNFTDLGEVDVLLATDDPRSEGITLALGVPLIAKETTIKVPNFMPSGSGYVLKLVDREEKPWPSENFSLSTTKAVEADSVSIDIEESTNKNAKSNSTQSDNIIPSNDEILNGDYDGRSIENDKQEKSNLNNRDAKNSSSALPKMNRIINSKQAFLIISTVVFICSTF
ncbi:hypothetical protein BB561_004709 [Smittium simulii]|uniref:Protein PBN1 n=1 Tax=Smittium simulii TaxID=133385 RepID=A0A2T9YEM0_9FUNG|nr:hypothetical protein BB561_004709 [Smittium simulii]